MVFGKLVRTLMRAEQRVKSRFNSTMLRLVKARFLGRSVVVGSRESRSWRDREAEGQDDATAGDDWRYGEVCDHLHGKFRRAVIWSHCSCF